MSTRHCADRSAVCPEVPDDSRLFVLCPQSSTGLRGRDANRATVQTCVTSMSRGS